MVHHGGIGTTAQALAAGIPQLVIPFSHDQPDNAARIERLGVGRSLSPKAFQAPTAAKVLAELLNSPEVAVRCKDVSSKFQGADPMPVSCRLIEELARR
jgi:UDP:flavonoid glycosyltransferase YjiC (YdhE family)